MAYLQSFGPALEHPRKQPLVAPRLYYSHSHAVSRVQLQAQLQTDGTLFCVRACCASNGSPHGLD